MDVDNQESESVAIDGHGDSEDAGILKLMIVCHRLVAALYCYRCLSFGDKSLSNDPNCRDCTVNDFMTDAISRTVLDRLLSYILTPVYFVVPKLVQYGSSYCILKFMLFDFIDCILSLM